VRLSVATRLTRPGSKRIAGVPEIETTNGAIQLTGAEISLFQNFMGLPIDFARNGAPGPDAQAVPIVVQRVRQPDGSYVLNPSVFNRVTGAVLNTQVTSQNTRKIGTGS
jgi:hypothetical protein